jgi:DNA polymerase-3 subunit gamma/tau
LGVEPAAIFRGLLETCHGTSLAKVGTLADSAQSAEERADYDQWAAGLSFQLLHRIWQLLLKGHDEVIRASDPREAADRAALRIIHASQLPDPGDLARKLETGAPIATAPAQPAAAAPSGGAVAMAPAPAPSVPESFPALIEFLAQNGRAHLAQQVHDYAGLIRYAPGTLVVRPVKPLPSDFARDLAAALKSLTGMNWDVTTADGDAQPSLLQQEQTREDQARARILATPLVKAAFDAFPDAELVDYEIAESSPAQRSIAS